MLERGYSHGGQLAIFTLTFFCSHIGVVGIDVPLSHIETIMRHELWGSAYAFMIDSKDGSAIIHPFSKPSAKVTSVYSCVSENC